MDTPPVLTAEETPDKLPDEFLGVDRRPLERLLILIRDNYKKADKAHFFLQRRAQTTNVYGLANLRDVLSHLAALLDPKIPNKQAQVDNAEEHLRRAILEPYETALNNFIFIFNDLYQKYKQRVIPVINKYPELSDAPTSEIIEERMKEIDDLALKGKSAKRMNLWDPEWEDGVDGFVNAYDLLSGLTKEIESYYNTLLQIERDTEQAAEQVASAHKLSRMKRLLAGAIILIILLAFAFVLKLFGLF